MKKLYTLIAVLGMTLILPLRVAAATHYDPAHAGIEYSSAPEGTVYMDILVKMDTGDESYAEFGEIPKSVDGRELSITAESEIAEYDEDGYVSLSLHHKSVKSFTAGNGGELIVSESCDFIDLAETYGDYKAAYVDENGNVLGVTEPARTMYSTKTPYGFSADGSSLIFQRHGAHPALISMICALFVVTLVALPLVIAFIYHKRTKKIRPWEKSGKGK